MPEGIIAELSAVKGYGFVLDTESGLLIRFDVQGLLDEVMMHDKVFFSVVDLYPGRIAINIRKIIAHGNLELDHDADSRQHRATGIGDRS